MSGSSWRPRETWSVDCSCGCTVTRWNDHEMAVCGNCAKQHQKPPATPAARLVKVGDVLVDRKIAGNRYTILAIRPGLVLPFACDKGRAFSSLIADFATHADGAPIDVGATLAALARDRANTPKAPTDSMDGRPLAIGGPMPYSEKLAASEALDKAAKRIAELEARCARIQSDWDTTHAAMCDARDHFADRCNRLSDQAGALATELREAQAIIGQKQTEIERLQRVVRGKR